MGLKFDIFDHLERRRDVSLENNTGNASCAWRRQTSTPTLALPRRGGGNPMEPSRKVCAEHY